MFNCRKDNVRVWCALSYIFFLSLPDLTAQQAQTPDLEGKGQISASGKFSPTPPPRTTNPQATQASPELTPTDALTRLSQSLEIKELGSGRFQIGKILLDQAERCVSLPMTVNRREGLVEYALVGKNGKTHEAIFTTTAKPAHLHLACLLLGQQPCSPTNWPADSTQIPFQHQVQIEVRWASNGPERCFAMEELISKQADATSAQKSAASLEPGPWFYSGSKFHGGTFAATQESSFISIIGDDASLINGLRIGHHDDLIHSANSAKLPRIGFPVTLTLRFPSATQKPSPLAP